MEPPPYTSRPVTRVPRDFLLAATLVAGHFLFSSWRLVVPDFALDYPFLEVDAYDWILNGLYLAGEDVRYTARPPLVPLLIAALDRLSLLEVFPVLVQAIVHLTILALYRLLRTLYGVPVALLVTAAWLLNASWRFQTFSAWADVVAACLLTASAICFHRAGTRPRAYVLAGLLGGLSAVAQQLALLLPLPVLLGLAAGRRADLRSRPFWIGVALFLAPTALWTAVKLFAFGTGGDVVLRHWSLLRFHVDTLGADLYDWVAFLGLPAALAWSAGVALLARGARRDPWKAFLLSLLAVVFLFFVFFYDWTAERFLVYGFLLSAVPVAEALGRIRSRGWLAVAGAAVLASAITPLPGTGTDRPRDARPRAEPAPPAAVLAGDRAAIWLYREPPARPRFIADRLGVLLRKRVQALPLSAFDDPRFRARLAPEPAGRAGGFALLRVRPPGLEGSWLIAVAPADAAGILPAGDGDAAGAADEMADAAEVAEERHGREGPRARTDGDARDIAALADARRLAALVGDDRPAVFLDPAGRDRWRLYLPFLLRSTELRYVEPDDAAARALLHRGVLLEKTRVGGVTVGRYRLGGLPWVVFETLPPQSRQDAGAAAAR